MITNSFAAVARAALAALAIVALVAPVEAQQAPPPPSAAAIALAKDIITAKGAANLYDPIIPGVIERAKATFVQINPMLTRDISDVANKMQAEMKGRGAEIFNEVAKLYAARFSEQELKDILAFYRSPVGKKVITEEPTIIDASVDMVAAWQRSFADEMMQKFRAEMKKKGHDL